MNFCDVDNRDWWELLMYNQIEGTATDFTKWFCTKWF
jgi:hypothetical protein